MNGNSRVPKWWKVANFAHVKDNAEKHVGVRGQRISLAFSLSGHWHGQFWAMRGLMEHIEWDLRTGPVWMFAVLSPSK